MERTQGRTVAPDTEPDTSTDAGRTAGTPSTAITLSYQRVIEEQAAHIASLQAALEHERAQSARIVDALAREQQLRALDATTPRQTFWQRLWKRGQT